jgi:predicted enzyme related to lactoylglutathione lyase
LGNPVVHFEVIGTDAAALQDFYSKLFGWKINTDNPANYGMVETQGEGGIGGGIGSAPGGGHVTFYVAVDDPKAHLEQVEKLGGRTVMGPTDIPGGPTVALFADPEGHVVGLVKGM